MPAPESTPDTISKRPHLRLERPIGEITMRVVKNGASQATANGAACDVQILHQKPATAAREVATLKVDGAPAERENLYSLLKRRACEAGANAVIIKKLEKQRLEGVKFDHLEAVALVIGTPGPPIDPSPTPKSITVTPEGA